MKESQRTKLQLKKKATEEWQGKALKTEQGQKSQNKQGNKREGGDDGYVCRSWMPREGEKETVQIQLRKRKTKKKGLYTERERE